MTLHITQSEIRNRLVALIATRTGVAAETIERGVPIWAYFPPGSARVEHPSVTAFVDDVHSQFDVYLTEDEWEEATVDTLVQHIYLERRNPEESLADWQRERAAMRKGAIMTFLFFNAVIVPIGWLSAGGPWRRRAQVVLALLVVVNGLLLVLYAVEARRQRARQPAGTTASRG